MITSIQLRQTNQFGYQLKVLFKYQKIWGNKIESSL